MYPSPLVAEQHYLNVGVQHTLPVQAPPPDSCCQGVQTELSFSVANSQDVVEMCKFLVEIMECILPSVRTELIKHITEWHFKMPLQDFIPLSVMAIEHLKRCGRSNVLYGLAKALGHMRKDGSDSRLPAKRMPMGLIEHIVNFYNADDIKKVSHKSLLLSSFDA